MGQRVCPEFVERNFGHTLTVPFLQDLINQNHLALKYCKNN